MTKDRIKIAIPDGLTEWKAHFVTALSIHGKYAVHRTRKGKGYTVTHLQTGMWVAHSLDRDIAEKYVQAADAFGPTSWDNLPFGQCADPTAPDCVPFLKLFRSELIEATKIKKPYARIKALRDLANA